MRFLHIGNICGIPNSIRDAQIELGYVSKTLSFDPDPHHISDFDYDVPYSLGRITSAILRMWILFKVGWRYNVFHFAGNSLANGMDIPFWKLLGKKIIIHYHGSEIRNKMQPWFHRFADATFTSTPDLLKFAPGSIWLPNPIDIGNYMGATPLPNLITHAPSDPKLKGTSEIIEIMKKLPEVNFDLISGVPYEEALEHYRKATIVIDQIKIGWYGMVTLECMAIGTPVMCYISDDLKDYLPNPYPLFITSENTLKSDIEFLLFDENFRKSLIKIGRDYVSNVHDSKNIAKIILKSLGVT
jgi:hypothetical protein